jgi:hypothetical protein
MKTVDHFIESLSHLSDKKFFEIARNILGDVKTPYHRQTIIEQLISYIANAELQKVLFSYITKDETLIINTVELLGTPCLHEIHDFLASFFSYTECIRLVTLLEERLVLYSYYSIGQEKYALNPVFDRMLKPILDDKSALFPGVKKSGMKRKEPSSFTVSKMFLFMLFSYVQSGKVKVKADNALTKKTEDQATAFFQSDSLFSDYFSYLLEISIYLGLLSIEEKVITANLPALKRFFKLSEIECRAYFAAAMSNDKKYAGLVMDFVASLSPEIYYTRVAVSRMFAIMYRKAEPYLQPPIDMFLPALENAGLLIKAKDPETGNKYYALPKNYAQLLDCVPSRNDKNNKVSIVFDSPFSFVVLPHTDIASVFDIIYFSSVENIREYRFVVNREAVVRCFETGSEHTKGAAKKNAAWIVERLKALSGNRLDETLAWTVNEWEKRFGEVILHEGLVLYLGKERRYLAETAVLKPYLEKALTDDVFIINSAHRKTVEKLLAKSGVDIIGTVPIPPIAATKGRSGRADFPPLPKPTAFPAFFTGKQKPHETSVPAVDYRKKFKAVLASLNAAETEEQELLLRIDMGLIFCEEQLKKLALPGTFPYEKNKAGGMDYSGKLLIAKSAFLNGIPVEISWPAGSKERTFICTITRIDRRFSNDVLILSRVDHNSIWEIPLSKVSMIRRIKQSIFE